MSRTATVSTHILDTARGRPAADVPVALAVRTVPGTGWQELGGARTDGDGRCRGLSALPPDAAEARLTFGTGEYAPDAFFPEVTVAFRVVPGEHHHVPLLLSPYGYSVYRGS